MSELVDAIRQFGLPVVLVVVLLYLLLKGEVDFHYPARPRDKRQK